MSAILQDPRLKLRAMTQLDVETCLAIEQRAYSHPWTEGIFRDCLRVGYHCRLLELDGQPIGYAVLSVAVGEAHLLNICIDPDMQRQGIGRLLLRRMQRLARERQADTLFLEVRVSNHAAQRLYESEGFNEIGQRRGYYPADGGREDALLYALTL